MRAVTVYFLTIFVIAVSHSSTYGGVWWTTVYNMPWFKDPETTKVNFPSYTTESKSLPLVPVYQSPCFDDAYLSGLLAPPKASFAHSNHVDLESASHAARPRTSSDPASIASQRPKWAKQANTRRGLDAPFSPFPNAAKRISGALKSLWSGTPTVVSTPPPSKTPLPVLGDFGNGEFNDCHRVSYGHFPSKVTNVDLPIARTHMKDWVKAECSVPAH